MQVPKLRFKEFTNEWISKKLGDICQFLKGGNLSKNDLSINGSECILYGELYTKYKEIILKITSKTNSTNLIFGLKNDILMPSSGETAIDIATASCLQLDNIALGGDINILRPYQNNGIFISYSINGVNKHKIAKLSQGIQVVHMYNDILKNVHINFPSIEEQTKIGDFLSLIDRKIEIQEKLVENLKLYKKGLLQKIFKNECQNVLLSSLLIEKNNKNSIGLEVCSVAVEKGVVNQVEHLGRSFSAKDTSKYNRVSYGNLVYTKSPTGLFPYGIIKQSYKKNDVAVSPLYAIYNPITFNVGVLIHSFFEYPINTNNYLHSLIQKGAKNTINISNSRFLEKSIPMPTDNSLIDKYANLIIDINDKISFETKKLQGLKTYKKGLLQKMFI